MFKRLLHLSFILLGLSVYGQGCRVSDFVDDYDQLFEYFTDHDSKSWHVLYEAGSKPETRINIESLNFINDVIQSNGKSVTNLANEIKSVNGFDSWKSIYEKLDKKADQFFVDFLGNTNALQKFKNDLNLVDSWKVLQNTSFSTEIRWLESFDALKKNDLLKYVSDISDAEATAIHRYTVNNFELTKGAYTGTLTAKQQEWIDLVNSGLDKLRPTKGYQGKVFRGSNRPESEIIEKYVNVYNEGVARGITPRVNEPPLLSTSKNADVAEDFIQRFKSPNNAEVMFEITSKRGVDIDDISDYGKNLGPKNHLDRLVQEEVILSNNQDYEILDVLMSTNTDGSVRYLIKLSE